MALGPGSIAFTGFNADGNDNISFVVLEEILAGTEIHFTDDEWSGATFNTGETKFTWIATGTIAAGTIVTIDSIGTGTMTTNLGTVAFSDPSNRGLAGGGDTLYAYVGTPTVPTVFLAAITSNGFTGATTTGLLDNTGLTLGTHAIDLGAITAGLDIGAYNGSRSGQANLSDYLPLINNIANWIGQNAGNDESIDGTPPDAPFSAAPFSAGATQTVGFAAGSTALSIAEGDAGTIVFTFTVERTGGTTGQVDFSGTFGLGGTNAADYGGTAPVGFSGTIPDGASSGEVTVTVSGDLDAETDETFTLTLTTATNASAATVLGAAAATGTVLNDDGTVLSAGDIAFTGFNAENTDNIAFAALTDIEAGTEIRFTDNEWSGSALNAGETTFVWTAGSDIAAGAIVTIDNIGTGTIASNLGAVSFSESTNRGLSATADTLYAYVGAAGSPTFLAAMASNGFSASNGELTGTGLTLGTHAIDVGAISSGLDIGAYNGSRSGQATPADYLPFINDTANWIGQNTGADDFNDGTAPDVPFDTTAFTGLEAGSIAFTGFNADGLDNIAFVALTDIAAGATIHFTDNEWSGTAFNTGESAFSWTAGGDIAAGTIITIDSVSDLAPTSNLGTVVYTDPMNRGLSNGDEVLYAYVGTPAAPTAFLAAVANNGFGANGQLTNTGLTVGTHAIDLGSADPEADVAAYTGVRIGEASLAAYLPLINNAANWITQDASGDQSADGIAPDVPFSTTTFVVGNPQIIGFSAGSVALSIAEGNAGTTTFTFTVERTGGTLGQVDFSGTIDPGNTDDDDFGGTTPISFSGTILDGAASGIVEVNVSGDTVFEAGEQFTLTLTSATNPDEDVSLGVNTATGTIVNDDAAPSVIANGETVSAMITLTGTDTLTIQNGGTLDVPALGNPAAVKILGPATAVVLDNSGLINSGSSRTIDAEFAAQDGNATIFNRATGIITQDDANEDRVIEISGTMTPGTVFTINNEGQIIAPERAIDTNGLTGDFVLNNYAGGIIESAAGFEAFRGTGVVNNWGIIRERAEGLTFDQAAIDFQSHAGGVVNNYSGGLIDGSRHGITGDLPVTLTNEAGATVRGRNGSGINLDTTSSDPVALVTNRGLISGNYNGGGDGDGDGVDVDGLLTLHNYGRVEGTGADNVANFADGVAAGGGEIYNYAGGVIFGESRGILIDDSNLGAAFAAALIVNEGMIGASLGPAIRMIGDWNDSIINSGRINGDVDLGGGADVFDTSTGKAVVGTVMGGAGIDTLTGSKFADTFDGGDGNDTLTGNGGNDVLGGGGDSDTINGGKGNDQIDGGTGNDTLAGNEGSDTIDGGDGSDDIDGGAGTDQLLGGIGEDTILGAGGNDVIDGGDDADTLSGEEGKDSLTGGGGNDDIDGGAGNDSLAGGEGDDTLDGGQGMDILTGGIGRDTLTGGMGADHFVFGPGDFVAGPPFDEITDFKHAQKDKIDLSSIDAVSGGGDDAFSFIAAGAFTGVVGQLHYVAGVGQVTVQGDINGDAVADFSVTVLGVASLVAGDFVV